MHEQWLGKEFFNKRPNILGSRGRDGSSYMLATFIMGSSVLKSGKTEELLKTL